MRKFATLLTVMVMLLSLAACGMPASEEGVHSSAVTPSQAPSEAQKAVVFADSALEAMICGAMGKPDGVITAAEAAAVTRLDLSADWERSTLEWTPIKDLDGLEYFTGLESLDLSEHAITDISPLARLTKLTTLALGGNPVADIAPLAGLTNLKTLILTGCAAQDYSPLANLTGLEYLRLDNSAIADAAPLASLTSLQCLYLEGCRLNYSPLAEIYPNLEGKDFTVATTLAEYGFYMDSAQAIYDGEQVSIRINRDEWGYPGEDSFQNCVRTVFGADEYKVDIGYYPKHDTYVVLAYKNGEFVLNYLYFLADDSFSVDLESRESAEGHVRAIFPDADGDVLLAPIDFHSNAIGSELGSTADALFELPFAPPSLEGFGFFLNEETDAYEYHEHEPHDTHISIYNPEHGNGPDNCSVEFYDDDVGGYSLLVLFFADGGYYRIALFYNGKDCAYGLDSDNEEYGEEYPDTETVRSMLSSAFGTQEEDMYTEPLVHLKKYLITRFDMSIDELYALPVGQYDNQ